MILEKAQKGHRGTFLDIIVESKLIIYAFQQN